MIYFIENELTEDIKIGKSANPEGRIETFQTGNSGKLNLRAVIECPDDGFNDSVMEGLFHKIFAPSHVFGEWFRGTGALLSFIRTINCDRGDEPYPEDHFLHGMKVKTQSDKFWGHIKQMDKWSPYCLWVDHDRGRVIGYDRGYEIIGDKFSDDIVSRAITMFTNKDVGTGFTGKRQKPSWYFNDQSISDSCGMMYWLWGHISDNASLWASKYAQDNDVVSFDEILVPIT